MWLHRFKRPKNLYQLNQMAKIKIRKTDTLFSEFIRDRDNWTCVRCHKKYDKNIPSERQGLHNSHFYGRGHESTRFEPDNCDALCYGCHRLWGHGDQRDLYIEFKKKQLGQIRWASLMLQAYQYKKRDDAMDLIIIKMLKENYGKNKFRKI